MVTIKNLPKSWDDISVKNYIALAGVDYTDVLQSLPAILTALDIDNEPLMQMKMEQAGQLADSFKFFENVPSGNRLSEVINYPLRDHTRFTFAEFIDLDMLITNGCNENIHQISAVLYSADDTYDFRKRKFRGSEFLDVPFSQVWGAVKEYLSYRLNVLQQYKGLFRMTHKENDPFYDEQEELSQIDSFSQKWGWYTYINRLANDDITKHEQVLSFSHVEALNQLAYFVERADYDKQRQKK